MPSLDEAARSETAAKLDEAWRGVAEQLQRNASPSRSPIHWDYKVTPAFPFTAGERPPSVAYYAFAYGLSSDFADAVVVAAPWAEIVLTLERMDAPDVRFGPGEQLSDVQGDEPLSDSDQAIYRMAPVIERQLFEAIKNETSVNGFPGADSILRFYRTWIRHNGVIAGHVRPFHEDFFLLIAKISET